MKTRSLTLIFSQLLNLSVALGAQTGPQTLGSDPSTFSVQIHDGQSLSTFPNPVPVSDRLAQAGGQLEIALSSWAPRNLRLDSFISDATAFAPSGIPTLSANFFFASDLFQSIKWARIRPEVGISILKMNRSGTLKYSSLQETVQQSLILIPMRVGTEISPYALRFWHLEPYLGIKLLPTVALSTRTAFSDGAPQWGVPLELSFGTEFNFPELTGSTSTSFGLGLNSTFGSIGPSQGQGDFSGLGIQLEFKLKT